MTASGLAGRQTAPRRRPLRRALITLALLVPLLAVAQPAQAASSKACENGGYALFSGTPDAARRVIRATDRDVERTIPAAPLGSTFRVRGRYNQFDVRRPTSRSSTTRSPARQRGDMTGGRRTPVCASKVPQHRGLSLSSGDPGRPSRTRT